MFILRYPKTSEDMLHMQSLIADVAGAPRLPLLFLISYHYISSITIHSDLFRKV
jgi:hypothetical protein